MNCNVIRDLIPSHIDGICSKETSTLVEKHIHNCEECKHYIHTMQRSIEKIGEMEDMDLVVAKEPFKRINKKRRLQVIIAIVITFMITIIGYQTVANVEGVNQFFFPKVMGSAIITDDSEIWQNIQFSLDGIHYQDYIVLDSIFFDKEVVNHAMNEEDVLLRVKDEKGHIIISEFQLLSGTGIELENLKKNEKYYFEIKAPQGRFTINVY